MLRSLAAVFLLTWSFRLSGYLTFGTWLAIPVVLLGLTGLLAIVTAWLPRGTLTGRRLRQIDLAVLAAVIVALGIWCYFQIYTAPDYGTDEIAFDQYAAQLALHGINPYLHSMAAAFPLFHVSPNGYTFLLNGRPVTKLSYPALAFEEYLPLLAMGITTQAAVWTDVAAWALGAVVLYAVLPRRLAPLAAVVVSLDVFTGYAVGGVTDFLFMPAADRRGGRLGPVRLDPRACRLARPGPDGPGHGGQADPVADPPVRGGRHRAGITAAARLGPGPPRRPAVPGDRRGGLPGAEPAVPAQRAPRRGSAGILTPVTAQTVPAGQGLVSLSLSLPIGGGSLQRLQRRGRRGLPGPARLLPGHLPRAQAGRLPASVDRAVLRHPVLRQLPGHADPGGGRRRGDHPAPAALGVLAALEMGRVRRGGLPVPSPSSPR